MANRSAHFKQASVKRAIAAVLGTGLSVARVDISADGTITIVPGPPDGQPSEMTELESWRAARRARQT
jgi:hypothetical protein